MDVTCDVRGASLNVSIANFPDPEMDLKEVSSDLVAVFAGGCFWCVEAVFQQLQGVLVVKSGYAGGDARTADYRSVCSGQTGHAEVIHIKYDPTRITFGKLLKVFFSVAHDPTTLNRQGNDSGTQYRSAIFYANERERAVAESYIAQLNKATVFKSRIVTKLEPLEKFYEAEEYHQNYAAEHPDEAYIASTARPKVQKLREYFSGELKKA